MTDDEKNFKTHIKEPRWQQVLSVLFVLAVIGAWAWLTFHR
jgi:hypothetical protein